MNIEELRKVYEETLKRHPTNERGEYLQFCDGRGERLSHQTLAFRVNGTYTVLSSGNINESHFYIVRKR